MFCGQQALRLQQGIGRQRLVRTGLNPSGLRIQQILLRLEHIQGCARPQGRFFPNAIKSNPRGAHALI